MKSIVVTLVIMLSLSAGRAEDLGNLSANPFVYESTANPFGRGSPFAPNGVNNPYGAGSPYRYDSPNNPYGKGWRIEGR